MAEATLQDVTQKLEEVKVAVEKGPSGKSATQKATDKENASEEKFRQKERVDILKDILEAIKNSEGFGKGKGKGKGTDGDDSDGVVKTILKTGLKIWTTKKLLELFPGLTKLIKPTTTGPLATKGATKPLSRSARAKLQPRAPGGQFVSKQPKGIFGSIQNSIFGKEGAFAKIGKELSRFIEKHFGKNALKVVLKGAGMASKLAGWALLLVAPILDGITGYFSAEDWGVSKLSGIIGGVLGGGEGGAINAIFNSMKWAALGAAAGTLIAGPIPGGVIGGIAGAIFGAILGWFGGDKIAKMIDKMGVWISEKWEAWVIVPLRTAWEAVVPKWIRDISFEWTDIFPVALNKLFAGEYFTVDFPKFEWTDLFPLFLRNIFATGKRELDKTTFGWKELMPPFLKKFFAGTYEKEGTFEWKHLLPPFITRILNAVISDQKETFEWQHLFPNFIVKLFSHDYIRPKESFEWEHLLPEWLSKFIDAGVRAGTAEDGEFDWTRLLPPWMKSAWGAVVSGAEAVVGGVESVFKWVNLLPSWMAGAWDKALAVGKTETGFEWSRLLPDWMVGAFKSTKGLIKQSYFGWKNLFPEWLQPYFTTTEGAVSAVWDKSLLKTFDWKILLPTFIQDFITDPTKVTKEGYKFSWRNLLPEFIVDMIGTGKDKIEKLTGISNIGQAIIDQFEQVVDSILSLIPGFESRAEKLAEVEKGIQNKRNQILEHEKQIKDEDFRTAAGFSRKGEIEDLVAEIAKLEKEKQNLTVVPTKVAEGGIVGMSPFAKGSLGKSMGLESGGLFTLSQGEFILDNQAAQTFLKAAQLLAGSQLIEQTKRGGGAPVTLTTNNIDNSQRNSSSQSTTLRVPESVRSGEPTMAAVIASLG